MDFPKKQQQCLIPRYLLQYLTSLEYHHVDPTAEWGSEGVIYTAGNGIEISDEDVISIDNTVALKTDIPSLTGYATETWVTNQGYLVQSDLSDYITSTDLSAELLNYAELSDLATVATTGDYGDLINKPDLSVYELAADAFSGDYNDLTNKPTIPVVPTNVSAFNNDAGYITSSDLTGYATETWVTNQGYLTSVSWNDISSKPTFATVATSGSYNDLIDKPTIPTDTSDLTNGAGYITSSALIGYATETWVTNQGYSTFSGSYNDLTNKPTIPDAVSGTNDGTNWTSLTIGSDTYGLASGSVPSNMVTTDTTQDITATTKNFIYSSIGTPYTGRLNFKDENGVKSYISYGLGAQSIYGGGSLTNFLTLADTANSHIGFRCTGRGVIPYENWFLAPHPSGDWSTVYNGNSCYYIPMVISDGTTNYYANEQGIVTIPAGGSSYSAGTGIDITNNTISIDNTVALKSEIPSTATSTSTSTFTPTTETLTFTYSDNTTATITIVTAATVSTTTTTTLS